MRFKNTLTSVVITSLALGLLGIPTGTAQQLLEDSANTRIERYWPLSGFDVEPGDTTFKGSVNFNGGETQETNVVFAVDVSGSTSYTTGLDCNGDGTVDNWDDYNQDGRIGDILDCEISAVTSLAAELRALENADDRINVSIVPFGSRAAVASMTSEGDEFVKPGQINQHENDKGELEEELTSAVNTVATSLKVGQVEKYLYKSVQEGTSFNAALRTSLDLLDSSGKPGWIFLLSDGEASASSDVLNRLKDNSDLYKVRTFAVGNSAGGCNEHSSLYKIAESGGDSCISVKDPTQLKTGLTASKPDFIDQVIVEFDGTEYEASVDSIGNWSVDVPGIKPGEHKAIVRVSYANGWASQTEVWSFTSASSFRQVSLGDSYSSGEGVTPYLGHDSSNKQIDIRYLCHRSKNSWPSKVDVSPLIGPNAEKSTTTKIGGDFSFQACSGAVIQNLDTKKQTKQWKREETIEDKLTDYPVLTNGLQLEHLTPDTDLVTLTIGGNDVGFGPIINHTMGLSGWGNNIDKTFLDGLSLEDWSKIRLALMHNELNGTYQAVRNRVSSETMVVVATYPRLFDIKQGIGSKASCLSGREDERKWIAKNINTFAEIIKVQAPKSNIVVADVREKFDGKGACSAGEALFGIHTGSRDDDLEEGPSATSLHPNEIGVDLYADSVSEAISDARKYDYVPIEDDSQIAVASHNSVDSIGGDQAEVVYVQAQLTTEPDTSKDDYFEDVVENPEAVLAQYPAEVVTAVQNSSFMELSVGTKTDANYTGEQCEAVVASEILPINGEGFEPNSEIIVTVVSNNGSENVEPVIILETTVESNALGELESEITLPDDLKGEILVVEVRGVNDEGGTTFGNYLVEASKDANCVAQAKNAGAIVAEDDRSRGLSSGSSGAISR